MGTSAKIQVSGLEPVIYFHFDGYPESTLKFLYDFTEKFVESRGNDESYYFAQLLRHSLLRDIKDNTNAIDDLETTIERVSKKFTSYGVFNTSDEIDTDYTYIIDLDIESRRYQIEGQLPLNSEECRRFLTNLGA